MSNKMIAALVVLLGLGTANAQEGASGTQSEFFFQAPAGQHFLTPHVGYRMQNNKATSALAGAERKESGLSRLGAQYEFGINEMFSVFGDLSYSSYTRETTVAGNTSEVKLSGLEDIQIGLKGTNAMGMGNLRFGLGLGLGLEKNKTETNGDENLASGGISLAPYVGYDMMVGPGILGGRLSYSYLLERTTEAAGTEAKVKGGNAFGLEAFYEYLLSDMIIGGKVGYKNVADDEDAAGTKSKNTHPINIGIYSRVPMAENGALLAGFDYLTSANASDMNIDSGMELRFNVGYRLGF